MRKGLLTPLLVWLGMGGLALAQSPYPPVAYPQAPLPVPYSFPGVLKWTSQPPILVGGTLEANGPLALPWRRGGLAHGRPHFGPPPYTLPGRHCVEPTRPAPARPRKRRKTFFPKLRRTGLSHGAEDRTGAPSKLPAPTGKHPHEEEPLCVEEIPAGPPPEDCVVEGWRLGPPLELKTLGHSGLPVPRGYKFYGTVDYLHYWVDNFQTSALVTVGGPAGTTIGGPSFPDIEQRQGYSTTLGMWLDPRQKWGIEGTFFTLGQRTPSVSLTSAGDPPIDRVFTDAATGLAGNVPVAAPGISSGGAQVDVLSRVWGFETNVRKELLRFGWGNVDLIGGFRYLHIDEGITIDSSQSVLPVAVFLSEANVFTHDFFGTENQYMAGQLGVQTEFRIGRFYGNLWGKCALGVNRQTVLINGSTSIMAPPAPVGNQELIGGVLAQPTNIGEYGRNQFMVLPEAGVKIGVQLTDNFRIGGGYTFLYLPNVVRPGKQIDPVVNSTAIPQTFLGPPVGNPRPAFAFVDEDLWIHGVNVELEFRY